jgi:hypothetical protein
LFRGDFLYKNKGSAFAEPLLYSKALCAELMPQSPPWRATSCLLHQRFGVEGDKQFFVCCNDDSLRRAILRDEVVGFLAALEVAFFINLVAEELEVVESLLANVETVFADAARENDSVDARESHGKTTDFTSEAVAENVESDLGALVAFACGLRECAHVVREAGEAEQAGFLVHQVVELVDGAVFFAVLLCDVEEDGRVEATGTCTHDKAFERCKAHGGIDALAIQNSGAARTVTEVSRDKAGFFGLGAENLASFGSYKAVACAVGAVTTDAVLFVELVRDTVEVSLLWHGLVECSVEHGDLRKTREELGGAFHAGCVCGFVERGKERDAADVVDDFLRDLFALDVLTAMHDAVADSFDCRCELLGVEELLDLIDGFGMRGAIEVEVDVAFGALSFSVTVDADVFNESACNGLLGLCVDDGELHRGRAAIKNEYAHGISFID